MKKYVCLLILAFCSLASFAQGHKITVYAINGNGTLDYRDAEKLLPDSIVNTVLINYKKKYNLKGVSQNAVLYRMNLDGWKVIEINRDTDYIYLSKEITLDDAGYQYFLDKLKGFEVK